MPFGEGSVDKLLASLLLSYLPHPETVLAEVRRVLRPGGQVVISSMRPDADISGALDALLTRVASADEQVLGGVERTRVLQAVRSYLNDAAKLLDLECDGVFRFYDEAALKGLLKAAGFTAIETFQSFGGQAVVAVARRPGPKG